MPRISKAMTDAVVAETLFDQLEDYRKRKGMKQSTLSDSIGITPKTYRNLKTGSASFEVFIQVVRYLGLLDNLNNLVPDPQLSPLQLLALENTQGHRQRVRDSKSDREINFKNGRQGKMDSTAVHDGKETSTKTLKQAFMARKKLKTKEGK